MKTVVLPIKKDYCRLIFHGTKRVEYRRSFPKAHISYILVYESRGCGRVIGELAVERILHMPLDSLWESTREQGAIERHLFDEYFKGKEKGFGIVIKDRVLYTEPKALSDFGIKSVPQNYMYIRPSNYTEIQS